MFSNLILFLSLSIISIWGASFTVSKQQRIINGEPVGIDTFPFQASIHFDFNKNIFCGGVVISPRGVLTAAHCLFDENPNSYSIRAGSTLREKGGMISKVSKVIRHDKFNSKTLNDDIGILITKQSMTGEPNVVIADIWNGDEPMPKVSVTCIGWGGQSVDIQSTPNLFSVNIAIVDPNECKQSYSGGNNPQNITTNQVCAGDSNGGPFKGDSGGPLLFNGKLYGIVSYGSQESETIPSVFTKVKPYLQWIKETLNKNSAA